MNQPNTNPDAVKRHWKIYRGTLRHRDMVTEVYWATSETGIKKSLKKAYNLDKDNYDSPGEYSYVYIEPTKRGLTEWLQRNINYDNG